MSDLGPGARMAHVFRRLVRDFVMGNPTGVAHAELSTIHRDERGRPSARLFDVALAAVAQARREDLSKISDRMGAARDPDVWPGEHYKLLAALVRVLGAKRVVEIGTFRGPSALALVQNLPEGGKVTTFDVIAADRIPGSVLVPGDFADGRLVQVVADLTDGATFEKHRALLEEADLLFVDAAKDGVMERVFLERFAGAKFARDPIIVFDDIRVWNMLGIWSAIDRPKLDLTSFGHYSGTGLIDWNGRSEG